MVDLLKDKPTEQYPEYKDSGVEWLGEIPKQWELTPLLAIATERQKKNLTGSEDNVLSLSYGKIKERNIGHNKGLLPESFTTYQIVEPGGIILRLTDLQNDKKSLRVGFVVKKGIITSAYLYLRPRLETNAHFLYYLLHSYDLQKVFYSMGGGLRQSMKFAHMRRLPVPLPALETQKRIANHLDKKTQTIDAIIQKKKQFIELLEEKRTSLITHAVTKGLDPKVELVDSGIEWIGKIPKGWQVFSIKWLLASNLGIKIGPFGSQLTLEEMVPKGYRVYGQENVTYRDWDRGTRRISKQKYLSLKVYAIKEGDILVTMMGTIGNSILVPHSVPKGIMDSHLIRLRVQKNLVLPQFLVINLTDNKSVRAQVQFLSRGATMSGLNSRIIKALQIALPSVKEQRQIIAFVKQKKKGIETALEKTKRSIELLREYRASLISNVVTGKVKV